MEWTGAPFKFVSRPSNRTISSISPQLNPLLTKCAKDAIFVNSVDLRIFLEEG
jgi:hypothetical protein